MTKQAVYDAIMEARRFIEKAEKCEYWRPQVGDGEDFAPAVVVRGSVAAAMKRASLDLTKALAELRRSQ